MSDANQREWRFYLDDMIDFAGKVLAYTDGLDQARATTLMASFTKGDRVGFQAPDGRMLEGMVLRLNKKTISVATDDGHQLNVALGLLRLVQSAGDLQWP